MVYWITGKAGSGKTTLAYKMKKDFEKKRRFNVVILDGDEIRRAIPTGYSDSERMEHIKRIARLAITFVKQGAVVIVACVSPLKKYRMEAKEIIENAETGRMRLVYLKGGDAMWAGTEYEIPDEAELHEEL